MTATRKLMTDLAPQPACFTCPLPDCQQDSAACPVFGARNARRKATYKTPEQTRAYNREYQRAWRAKQREKTQ